MKFKKVLALALAGAMCLTAFAGCTDKSSNTGSASNSASDSAESSTEEEKITATIKVWSPAEDQAEDYGQWLQTRCEAFNDAHPNWNLTFVYEVCGEDKAYDTVSKDPAAAADVYMFANDQINKLIDCDAISKIGGSYAEYVKSTNSEAMYNSVVVDGDVYGFPYTGNTWYMFYNKSIFSEEDIKNLDTMLTKGKVAFPLTNSWYIASFYVANGCTLFGDGTDESAGIDFGGDKAVAVTDYLVDLVANPNFMNDTEKAGITGLKDGTVGAMFTGSWDAASIKTELGDNFGVAALPTFTIDGEEKQLYSYAGSKAVGVNKNTEYPQVANALAQWLANTDSQLTRFEARGVIPCDTSLLENDTVKADATAVAQLLTIDTTSIMQPFVTAMDNYWGPAENMGKAIVAKNVTHDNSADQTEEMNTSMNTEVVK